MPHPLTDRIAEVKQTARRLAIARVVGLFLSMAVVAGLLIACFDYLLRLEDTGTRVLFSLVWLTAGAALARYWLTPVLRASWSDQSIAHMLERRFPDLADRLSSSLAFLTQSDESLASKQMMRNVIAETTTIVSHLDLKDAVDRTPTWKALGWTALVAAVCLGLGVAFPGTASQAVSRLLTPWRENSWPRVHHLKFVNPPSRVARGGDLRLALVDESGKLPSRVDLHLWYEGQNESEADVVPMQRIDEQMVLQRSNVVRAFKYRASGGDDELMKWSELKVVEPPRVVSGTIQLTPPAYTGWLPHSINEPLGSLRLLEDTRVVLTGTADRALSAGKLEFFGIDSESQFSASISENGLQYAVPNPVASDDAGEPWTVRESGEYSLSLTDRQGTKTVATDKWNVRMLADESPSLTLIEPDAEELITPRAIVGIRCDVEDDLAVKRVDLRYLRTDRSDQGESLVALFQGVASLPEAPMPATLPPPVDAHQIAFEWPLEVLQLPAGAVISFHVSAEDYKQQIQQTLPRRLVVVSESDLLDRAGRRQSLVLARIQQRLKQQRQAKQQLDTAQMQLRETNLIEKPTMDRLQSALLAQRQVNAALLGDDAEVVQELRRLKTMLDRSRIGEVDVRTRIENTLASIDQLGTQHLAPAIRSSTSAQRSLQAKRDQEQADDDPEVPEDVPVALEAASQHQAAAIKWLEELLDEMSAWDNYRRFAQELSDLLRQQRDLNQATQEVAKGTLTQSRSELDGKQRAALRGASARQLELARRADRTLSNLATAEQELGQTDPQAAQMIRDAMEAAREGAVSGKMREAGRQIERNRLGLAGREQAAAEEALQNMLDGLSRRSYSPEERAEKVSAVGRDLQQLQKRQAQLTKDFQEADSSAERKGRQLQRLTKRQKEVAQAARRLQRQMQRLRATESARHTGQAASSSDNAATASEQGDGGQAAEKSQLAEAQMEQAQQSLQQEIEKAKSELAREQLVRLPQLVDALIAQQTGIVEEVIRLDEVRVRNGIFSSGQQASVEVAAEAQRAVAQDTELVAGQMSELPAFVFALTEVQYTMSEVAEALGVLNTSTSTRENAGRALDELKLIRKMMEGDAESKGKTDDSEGQGGQAAPRDNSRDFDARLAQLKLLRDVQVAINDETRQLNMLQPADAATRRHNEKRLRELADRQGELAKTVSKLLQQVSTKKMELPKAEDRGIPGLDELDRELDELLR